LKAFDKLKQELPDHIFMKVFPLSLLARDQMSQIAKSTVLGHDAEPLVIPESFVEPDDEW
jgi:hypothetical protein